MGYRIFYSYQSDIDKKLNLKFIRKAINDAVSKIKDFDIDPLIEGFYGVGGNPPLAAKMLQQSEFSDIFIGDVTFTSSKVWHNPLSLVENDNSYSLEIPKGDLKPSPNPNVLIETGYSWALKSYERTILVMNTAFGPPENLPVDMGDKRHPITYNLSLERFNKEVKQKKEFEALSGALHDAILTVINSDADYQRKRWAPMLLHKDWIQRDFWTIYRPTTRTIDIIKKLRVTLENPNIPQRIVGPKNSGKTRLVYEIYKAINESLPLHENIANLIYYDLKGERFSDIVRMKFQDLKNSFQRKILVLDNCPITIHKEVFNELPIDGKISLLSIGDNEDGEGASFFIDKDFAQETIEKISNEIGNQRNTNFIIDSSKGNLREAIALIGKIPEGEVGLSENYQTRWQQILGSELYSKKKLEILEELSLFTHVGLTDRFEKQSEILLNNTQVDSKDELNKIIEELAELGIVKITGDFIILEAFIEELAINRIERLTKQNLKEYFLMLTHLNLSKQFSNRLIELNKFEGTKELISKLSKENGLLRQENFVDSDQGAKILMSLSEIEPEVVLDILNQSLADKSLEELKKVENGRRYLVWTLERLVYRKETFKGAIKLLFRLAVAENESIGNNATSQFCQLYQLFLPATIASLEDRILLIKDLLENASDEEKIVITNALDRALMTGGFTRMGGADKQAGLQYEDYKTDSKDEILNYWKEAITLLEEIGAYDILVSKFNTQVYNGNTTAMIDAIDRMLKLRGTIDKDLRQQFEHIIGGRRVVKLEITERIQSILKNYSSNSIREQLEFKVALAPYSTDRSVDGKIINKSEEKLVEFVSELIASGNNDWLADIDVLLHNEQRLTYAFGREIGSRKEVYEELIDSAIEKLAEIPFEQQNNSLIAGYISGFEDAEKKRAIIDRFLANPKIAFHAIQMTRTLAVQFSDLEKLKNLINEFPRYVVSLQYLGINHLTHEEIVEFLEWLKTIEPYGRWVGVDLYYGLVEKLETLESHHIIVVKDLLFKEGILSEENMHNMFAVHEYVELFKKLNHEDLDDSFIRFLANEIIEASKEVHFNNEYHLKDILEILIKNSWDNTWSVIGSKILEQDYFGWYNMKGLLSKIRTFDDDKLLLWMDKYPKDAPQRVVDFVMFNDRSKEIDTWSPLLLEMFNRYYGNEQFLSHLYSELHSFSWSGSLVPTLEKRIVLMEQLLDHEKKEIQDFAKENISHFTNDIKREERRDENYGLDF